MSNYNKLLFSGGLRRKLHLMRFDWVKKHLTDPEGTYSLFELGCFDCRSLGHIPRPRRYVGADAGWEGGLNDAQMTFVRTPWVELVMARTVHDLKPYESQRFDYTMALETLEHIPDAVLKGYIEFLANVTTKRLYVTVPVEIGFVFLAKYLAKRIFSNLENAETSSYSLKEVYWATRGKVEHVRRYEHKGFDYRLLIESLKEYFDITHIEGIPIARCPGLSFQVGIIAVPKKSLP